MDTPPRSTGHAACGYKTTTHTSTLPALHMHVQVPSPLFPSTFSLPSPPLAARRPSLALMTTQHALTEPRHAQQAGQASQHAALQRAPVQLQSASGQPSEELLSGTVALGLLDSAARPKSLRWDGSMLGSAPRFGLA
eukprot:scaffold138995_cov14-Tisochrysis_lutea.AAC.1